MNAPDIARKAAELVGGDRAIQHGDKRTNHACIAAVWNGILECRRIAGEPDALDAHDVATLMEGLKIARRYNGAFNIEDYTDAAGYSAVAGEIASPEEAKAPVRVLRKR